MTGEDGDFKFDVWADHRKSKPMDDKPSLKGRSYGHMTPLNFGGPNHICGTAEASCQILCMGRLYHLSLGMTAPKWAIGHCPGHVTHLKFWGCQSYV